LILEVKRAMKELLDSIRKACADYRIVSLERQIQAVDHLLGHTKVIDVAVLGQFKAGKSSFLNGFIGREILPVGVIPLTSVITRIAHGEREKVMVVYFDGHAEEVVLGEIGEYVSESKNPENRKNVLWVDIELPELLPYRGLRFVDTPGLGSIFKHNSEVTEKWAPEIGVAVVAISADRPLSESEILLIREAEKYSPDIIVLLTKADLFDEAQIREIVDFMDRSLRNTFGREIPVYRFSSKKETAAYRERLVRDLFSPLMNDFGAEFEKIVSYKIHSLANGCLSYLGLSLEVSKRSDAERENLKDLILSERLSVEYVRNELLLVTTNFLGRTRDAVYEMIKPYRSGLNAIVRESFDREYPMWRGNLFKVSRRYEQWINDCLRAEIKKIADVRRQDFVGLIEQARQHFSFFCRSFRERLNQSIRSVLGIEISSEEWVVEIREIRNPDVRISRTSDFHLDLLWFLFPMFLYRGIFRRHFARQIPYEINKNIHRVTSDISGIVNRSIEDLKDQTYRFIVNELSTVESVMTGDRSTTGDLLETMERITRHLRES
jgi:prepilin-type processing-associated H-X9-DG protein